MNIPFWSHYARILRAILEGGIRETNRRTGSVIAMLPEGASFVLDLSDGLLPTCGLRKTRPHIAAAELAWCLRGDNHIDWLRRHTKVWDAFADARDCASCGGGGKDDEDFQCPNCDGSGKTYWLDQAYGYRWRVKFGIDQLATGIERLKIDPSDRRVWISSWDPSEDIIIDAQKKTVPCPVGFTLSVMADKLCSTFMIRSSDLYMGLPYDIYRHAFLMASVAASLNRMTGYMRVVLAHPHIYEQHFENCRRMLEEQPVTPVLALPYLGVDWITKNADDYVSTVQQLSGIGPWPTFDPKARVVR